MSLYDNLSHRILITQTPQLLLIIIPPSATNFFSSNIGITSDSLRWKTNIDLFGIVDFNDFIVTNTQHRASVVSNKRRVEIKIFCLLAQLTVLNIDFYEFVNESQVRVINRQCFDNRLITPKRSAAWPIQSQTLIY